MQTVNALVQGLLLGGLYALFAAGLSLLFGVMRQVNLAHGDFAVLAAYLAVGSAALGLTALTTMLVVVPVMALIGYLLQRAVLERVISVDPLPSVLVTFGLGVVVQNVLLQAFSADTRALDAGALSLGSWTLGGLVLPWSGLLTMSAAVLVIGAIQVMLSRTALGRRMRAAADDPEAARGIGVDTRHVYGLAAAVAFASLGVAAVLLATRTTFAPSSGTTLLIFAFEAVIIGGLGSLWGTLLGGALLGVGQAAGAAIDPSLGVLFGHLVFLAVLAFKPNGLSPKAITA